MAAQGMRKSANCIGSGSTEYGGCRGHAVGWVWSVAMMGNMACGWTTHYRKRVGLNSASRQPS